MIGRQLSYRDSDRKGISDTGPLELQSNLYRHTHTHRAPPSPIPPSLSLSSPLPASSPCFSLGNTGNLAGPAELRSSSDPPLEEEEDEDEDSEEDSSNARGL